MNKPITNTRHKLTIEYPSPSGSILERKMVVSTNHSGWKENELVILAFSIHSAIYDGLAGYFKISAWVNTIKLHTKAKIIILLCEGAHLNVASLKYKNNVSKAAEICRYDADLLYRKFEKLFAGCEVVYWQDYIKNNNCYENFKNELNSILEKNIIYQDIINSDIEKTYVNRIIQEYPDKDLYVKNARLDLIEMILGMKVIYENGCRSLLYPGVVPAAMSSIRSCYYNELAFVNVSIKTHKQDKEHDLASYENL
jgi:hypothetical protein